MAQVLEGHLREHVGAPGLSETARSEAMDQVTTVLRSYLR